MQHITDDPKYQRLASETRATIRAAMQEIAVARENLKELQRMTALYLQALTDPELGPLPDLDDPEVAPYVETLRHEVVNWHILGLGLPLIERTWVIESWNEYDDWLNSRDEVSPVDDPPASDLVADKPRLVLVANGEDN